VGFQEPGEPRAKVPQYPRSLSQSWQIKSNSFLS
jgi:hypothetical protein